MGRASEGPFARATTVPKNSHASAWGSDPDVPVDVALVGGLTSSWSDYTLCSAVTSVIPEDREELILNVWIFEVPTPFVVLRSPRIAIGVRGRGHDHPKLLSGVREPRCYGLVGRF